MAASGAPPIPIKALVAEISMIIGKATPIPAIAKSPSGNRPIKIRSTILYKTLTNWAIIAGVANLKRSFPIESLPKSVVCVDIIFLL